jgi:hypothetical protein
MNTKCSLCGDQTKGSTGYCRTCKFLVRRCYKRVEKEGLVVDTAGGSWWVWDKRGTVLVIGKSTKTEAVVGLERDLVEEE